MRDWSAASLRRLIDAARGHRPVDLCIRGCRMVNVFSGTIETVNLGIDAGFIVGWGDYEAEHSMEAEGMFACPGFIDGHIHIESTMLSPAQFAAAVLPWGTTAVVADPHELANVYGLDGIRYLLEAVEGIPLDFYFNLPSCVPASPLETSGAHLSASDLHGFKAHPRILGLAEVMNFPGVLMGVPEIMEKLLMFRDVVVDGHAPGLGGLGLNGYVSSGIRSDHECTSLEEAREKLARGMTIMIREGSQSKDLAALLPLVGDQTWPQCMFVSDDRHPDDLWREGHMNTIVNRAMSMGMEPVRALTLASLTPARYFGLSRRGAIAPEAQCRRSSPLAGSTSISEQRSTCSVCRIISTALSSRRPMSSAAERTPAASSAWRQTPALVSFRLDINIVLPFFHAAGCYGARTGAPQGLNRPRQQP